MNLHPVEAKHVEKIPGVKITRMLGQTFAEVPVNREAEVETALAAAAAEIRARRARR